MREIRTFELEEHDAVGWRIGQSQSIEVLEGQMWLTFERGSEDIWLTAPGSIELPAGTRAWISGWRGPLRFRISQHARIKDFYGCFTPPAQKLPASLSWLTYLYVRCGTQRRIPPASSAPRSSFLT